MNEGIKELAAQALIPFKDENGFECHHFSKEKFAELIVKECIKLCDQVDLVGADDCIYFIKEHFEIK